MVDSGVQNVCVLKFPIVAARDSRFQERAGLRFQRNVLGVG